MVDRPTTGDRPLYAPVEFMSFEEWADSIEIRTRRLQEFVIPQIARGLERMTVGKEATYFTQTAILKLEEICQTRYTNVGNPPSEHPIFCILDGKTSGNGYMAKYNLDGTYNLNGIRGDHSSTTLIAAQILINALCPELGISLYDGLEESLNKAQPIQVFGFADLQSHYTDGPPEVVEFSTILPGVTLRFSFSGRKRYIHLSENIM